MEELFLFTDGSVNNESKIGFGAYLITHTPDISAEKLKKLVKTVSFESTSSTKLEIQTLIFALKIIQAEKSKVTVFTDSQNIVSLLNRRERLESGNYITKSGKHLKNRELYLQFYELTDKLNCRFVKIRGHKPSKRKDNIEQIFTLVDRASRDALRKNIKV